MIRLKTQSVFLMPMLVALAGCAALSPPQDVATLNKINTEMKQAAQVSKASGGAAAVPQSIANELLPPLKAATLKASAKQLEQRFDLVISDAPVNQVFMAIVSGTRYSMLVHPDVKGTVSVNLKDVTILEALNAMRDLYGFDYTVDGSRIFVVKPSLQAKIFKVNYISGIRRGSSDINVTSGASGDAVSSNSSGSSTRNGLQQASKLNMSSRTDFWGDLEDGVRTAIGCKIPGQSQSQSASNNSGNNTSGTQNTLQSEFVFNERRDRGNTGCPEGKSVVLNQMAGTLFVRAMPDELRIIESMLHTMQVSIEKQVILEAKIIDVVLNDGAQQGINWAVFQDGLHRTSVGGGVTSIGAEGTNGGAVVSGSTLSDLLGTSLVGTGSAVSSGLGVALQIKNFSALLNFLQTQGTVNVLSSPRISTINNQKAVLKVGKDEQYVTGFDSNSNTTNTTGGTTVNLPTPVYSTFFSGISLDVTPQIDDDGNITLHVHPLVSEVTEVEKKTINNQTLPFASNKISETDSVVKVTDGQIVVIGGLMTESSLDSRGKVSGLGDIPGFGALFRKGSQGTTKRELVIMIKPTLVRGNDSWTEDISATQQRIEQMAPKSGAAGTQ